MNSIIFKYICVNETIITQHYDERLHNMNYSINYVVISVSFKKTFKILKD